MKITPLTPLFEVRDLHQVQTKWNKTNMIKGIRLPVLSSSQRANALARRGSTNGIIGAYPTIKQTTNNKQHILKVPLRGHRAARHGRAEALLKGQFRLIYNRSYPAVKREKEASVISNTGSS